MGFAVPGLKARRASRSFGIRAENGGTESEIDELVGTPAVPEVEDDLAGG